jgi:hypothetical protein
LEMLAHVTICRNMVIIIRFLKNAIPVPAFFGHIGI